MKRLLKVKSFAICTLLALVSWVGCKQEKETEREVIIVIDKNMPVLITCISTEGFNGGDVVAFGDDGRLMIASQNDKYRIGMVIGKDSILTY